MPLLSHRDAQLVIVGEGPQRSALAQQIAALGLRERIRLAGNQNDVAPWLAAFDVFALPSYANEGVPQALVQAMFAGVPCVTTDAGAIGEIALAEHTALVVPKHNAVALAAAIDRMLGDDALAAGLTGAAHKRVASRFGLGSMLDGMEACFPARDRSNAASTLHTRRRARFAGRAQVVARALAQRAASTGPRRPPRDPRRILIAHHLLLGDTLMLTPLLAKLRARHPSAELIMALPRIATRRCTRARPTASRAGLEPARPGGIAAVARTRLRSGVRAWRQPLQLAGAGTG